MLSFPYLERLLSNRRTLLKESGAIKSSTMLLAGWLAVMQSCYFLKHAIAANEQEVQEKGFRTKQVNRMN